MDEVRREIDVRKRIYDRWVADGKVSWTEAHDRLERLCSALSTLIEAATNADREAAEAERTPETIVAGS